VNVELAFSRPQKSAEGLGDLATDRHRFLEKRVLLTGEPEILNMENGRAALLYALRLLVRICPNLTVTLPESCESLLSEAHGLALAVAFGKAVEFSGETDLPSGFDAILSVGSAVYPALPFTVINSNGWVARVSSGQIVLPKECSQDNPIAALAAACLGVGEVFKRLIGLKPARGVLLDGLSFSLRTYELDPANVGPPLPERLDSDLLVVGAGAIGNGIVALLSALPFVSQILVVDREKYGPENLGTCMLVDPTDIGQAKAKVMEEWLKAAGKNAVGMESSFADYADTLSNYPKLVLNGLDNIDVRHEVQRMLWPDLIVDGAIGDFTCQVSRHLWTDENAACLLCLFRKPCRSAEAVAFGATGLATSRLGIIDAVVTVEDVTAAPKEKQEYLRANLGRPICSVVSEAVTAKISQEEQARGFEPSVPFVAAFSACMVVAEAVAFLARWPSLMETRYQFDFLAGPAYGLQFPEGRRADCLCQRRKNIAKLRAAHGLYQVGATVMVRTDSSLLAGMTYPRIGL